MLCPLIAHAVGSCCTKFEIGRNFSYVKTDATKLPPLLGQQCWELLHPFARSFIAWQQNLQPCKLLSVVRDPQSHSSKLESTTYLLWLVEASLHTMAVQSVSSYPITKRNLEFYRAKKILLLSVTYRSVTMFNEAYMCPLIPLVYTQKTLTCILITYPYAKLIITFKHS